MSMSRYRFIESIGYNFSSPSATGVVQIRAREPTELSVVEDFPDLLREDDRRVRLVQKRDAGYQFAIVYNGLVRVARREQHPRARLREPEPMRQLLAAHARHHQVGKQQVE